MSKAVEQLLLIEPTPRVRRKRKPARGRPKSDDSGVSHLEREEISRHHPVHGSLHTVNGVGSLRRQRMIGALEEAFRIAKLRFGMRVVHYSVQGNHVHLLVEVDDREALSRGMQGLAIRLAKTINRLAGRSGQVWVDRYYAHVLRTRREVANALRYVLGNFARHARQWDGKVRPFIDACSSVRWLGRADRNAPVAPPVTWLLRVGWMGAG